MTSLLLMLFVLILPSGVWADDDWWPKIQRAAEACFSGRKFSVELNTGASMRTLGERARTGPFAEVRISVPLWDKEKRQQEKQAEGAFLERAAAILGEMREADALITVKSQEAKVLRESLIQAGQDGITRFFAIQGEIAILKTTAEAAEMKLEGFMKACGVQP